MRNTRNILSILRSGAIGTGVSYLGASLLAAISVIDPTSIPKIALASAIGNSTLTLIAGNSVETVGVIGEVTSGLIAALPKKVLPYMTQSKSIFSSSIIPTAALTIRETTGVALGLALLSLINQFGVMNALSTPFKPAIEATAVGTIVGGLSLHFIIEAFVLLGMNVGLPTLQKTAAILGMETFNQQNHDGEPRKNFL